MRGVKHRRRPSTTLSERLETTFAREIEINKPTQRLRAEMERAPAFGEVRLRTQYWLAPRVTWRKPSDSARATCLRRLGAAPAWWASVPQGARSAG